MENRPFQFRLLVVEDDPRVIKMFEDVLRLEFPPGRYQFQIIACSSEARIASESVRFHFFSLDQNLPEIKGESVYSDSGIALCENLYLRRVMAQKVIYTAFGQLSYANHAGRLGGTPYWAKDTQTKKEQNKYTSYDWAKTIRGMLEDNHLRFSLEQCALHLPLSMADRSIQIINALDKKNDEATLKYLLELWDNSVHLALNQSMVLCKAAGIHLEVPLSKWRGGMQKQLNSAWSKLAEKGWMTPWAPYIGQRGLNLLDGALNPLLALRNEDAHTYDMSERWKDKLESAMDPFYYLIDALAFWVEHPFVTRAHYHPTMRNRVMATILTGNKLPLSNAERVPNIQEIPVSANDHILLPWKNPDGNHLLLSCAPFMILDPVPSSNRQDILLLSHGASKREWYYRSLMTGKLHKKVLSQEESDIILSIADM